MVEIIPNYLNLTDIEQVEFFPEISEMFREASQKIEKSELPLERRI
jgi:hypothetical protein